MTVARSDRGTVKLRLLIGLGLISGACPPVMAGNDVGNGGNVLICESPQGSQKPIELLDYFEGREFRGLAPDLGPDGGSIKEKVEVVLKRIERFDPERANLYRSWANSFASESIMLDQRLPSVGDQGALMPPENCKVHQAVVQRTPQQSLDKRYFIDLSLWNQLDDLNKAGLMLHEIIYRDALARGHLDSLETRYLNSVLSSTVTESFDQKRFDGLMHEAMLKGTVFIYRTSATYVPDAMQLPFSGAVDFCKAWRPGGPSGLNGDYGVRDSVIYGVSEEQMKPNPTRPEDNYVEGPNYVRQALIGLEGTLKTKVWTIDVYGTPQCMEAQAGMDIYHPEKYFCAVPLTEVLPFECGVARSALPIP